MIVMNRSAMTESHSAPRSTRSKNFNIGKYEAPLLSGASSSQKLGVFIERGYAYL